MSESEPGGIGNASEPVGWKENVAAAVVDVGIGGRVDGGGAGESDRTIGAIGDIGVVGAKNVKLDGEDPTIMSDVEISLEVGKENRGAAFCIVVISFSTRRLYQFLWMENGWILLALKLTNHKNTRDWYIKTLVLFSLLLSFSLSDNGTFSHQYV